MLNKNTTFVSSTPGLSLRNLGVLAYNGGFTLWYYNAANDDLSAVLAPNYFRAAADLINDLDVVIITSKEHTTSTFYFTDNEKGEVILKATNNLII